MKDSPDIMKITMEANAMAWTALRGTTVGFHHYNYTIVLEKENGSVMPIQRKTFEKLYREVGPFVAALKGDCIEYASNDPMIDLFDQPEWYIDACADMIIYENCGQTYIQDDYHGEIAMSPNSVVLRNFKGELRYMEWDEFDKYYDVPGSEFID